MNLATDVQVNASLRPEKPAIVSPAATLTYGELDEWASRIAEVLADQGIVVGDRVGVLLPSTADHVATYLGILKLGAIHVGAHLQLTRPELAYQFGNAGIAALVADASSQGIATDLVDDVDGLDTVLLFGSPSESAGCVDLEAAARSMPGRLRAVDLAAGAAAVIFYTSGTTGVPKGVVHSHAAISVLLDALVRRYSVAVEDTHIIALPLFLLAILIQGPALSIRAGGTLYLLERYEPRTFGRWVTDHRITFSGATIPTMFIDLAELPEAEADSLDISSLRVALCGGSPLPERLRARFEERYGTQIVFGFGGTEGPGGITADPVDGRERRTGSVGVAMDHIDVRIIDEHDLDVPLGEVGEIVTGPRPDGPFAGVYLPMVGYWGMPEATELALRGGYLHWGDLGRFDEDGYLYIVDRLKDMIIRAGMNIYPAELERVILADRRVAGCAVVGIPTDARLGEVPKAFVELVPGSTMAAAEVEALVAEGLARYKHLAAVEFVERLPRNALGKILKRELRSSEHEEEGDGR